MKRKSTHTVFLGLCPVCHKKLKDNRLAIIDKSDDSALCCVTCVSCASSLMFEVSSLEGGMVTTVGILADIQEEDLRMLKTGAPVSSDDVLDLHTYLENKT